ncbi:MAG: M14 metallopeptidase family protein [Sediminicola sp.]|tara:strand:+ start:3959 stop:5428 length:1470 start_codon:yes stop_codon:yes gene_type:complete
MRIGATLTLLLLFMSADTAAQETDITSDLYETYKDYRENSLGERRIKHADIRPLLKKLAMDPKYTVRVVGESIEGRDLTLVSIGSGPTSVFLWSQMHGDEPTATQAIFDIFNFLDGPAFVQEKEDILSKLTLHFLPMLNPDGAEAYTRRNRLGIDINRDALHLQSPEGRTLKKVRDSLDADFGFNLHDQSTYYNAERTSKPATISYLAPAYNYEKDINEVRGNAMKVIVFMNRILQKYAPGQVGRYNDDFEPRAFGDNIQKWGTSAILIESGGYPNDPEKQEIRKLNYVSILSALYTIAKENYADIPLEDYEKIPENDRKLFDLKLEGITYGLLGKDYLMDLGFQRNEVDVAGHSDFYYSSSIADQGDLSTFYGYETLEASGYRAIAGKVHPKTFASVTSLTETQILEFLKSGYTYLRVSEFPSQKQVPLPINVVGSEFKAPTLRFWVGLNPSFLLEREGKIEYAVINGFLIDLKGGDSNFKNALTYKK